MADVNSFNNYIFINGEPILVKDICMNQIDEICPDSLSEQYPLINTQLIDNNINSGELSTNFSTNVNDPNSISILNRPHRTTDDGCAEQNELITVLANDNNLEDTTAIRLTVEQAAQLGLELSIDSVVDTNLDNSSATNMNNISIIESSGINENQENENDKSNLVIDSSKNKNTEKADHENGMGLESENNIDSDVKSIFLNPIVPENPPLNQQLTLVPQILNGVLTYTLQLSNEESPINEVTYSNENSCTYNKVPLVADDSESVQVILSSNNLSTDTSFTNPTAIPAVSNEDSTDMSKPSVVSVIDCNSSATNQEIPDRHLVPSEIQNMTYPRMTEALSDQNNTDILTSSINSQVNDQLSDIQQHQLTTASINSIPKPPSISRDRIIYSDKGESLLLKHKNSMVNLKSTNVENNKINHNNTSYIVKQFDIGENANKFISGLETNKNLNTEDDLCKNDDTPSSSLIIPSMYISSETLEDPVGPTKLEAHSKKLAVITPLSGEFDEEVSNALSQLPLNVDTNKPLGSGENPIKLVQRGATFVSAQNLTESHISLIKPYLQQKLDLNAPSHVFFDPATRTRITYRIISPSRIPALGRNGEVRRKRGRPRKLPFEPGVTEENAPTSEGPPPLKKVFSRTRSGRLSRPPKHMVRDFKHLKRPGMDGSEGDLSDYQSEAEPEPSDPPSAVQLDLLPGLVARRTLKRNISKENVCPTCSKVYLGYERMKRHFDNYPGHGSIEFLNTFRNIIAESEAENNRVNGGGVNRKKKRRGRFGFISSANKRAVLKEALSQCSESDLVEVAGPAAAGVLSLWQLLLLRVRANERDAGGHVSALMRELRALLAALRHAAESLFRPLDRAPPPADPITVEIDEDMTSLFNLPCGLYLASDEDLKDPVMQSTQITDQESQVAQTEGECEESDSQREDAVDDPKEKPLVDEGPVQYTLSDEIMMDIDRGEKELINVDDIIDPRLHNFTGGQNSAVEDVMKGLNELVPQDKTETEELMEEFAIVSRRPHVSASTEDLIDSLNFEAHLPHNDPNSSLVRDTFDRTDPLDFEVLSREFHSNNR